MVDDPIIPNGELTRPLRTEAQYWQEKAEKLKGDHDIEDLLHQKDAEIAALRGDVRFLARMCLLLALASALLVYALVKLLRIF